MKTFLLSSVLALCCQCPVLAQDLLEPVPLVPGDTSASDSSAVIEKVPAAPARKLLPDNMSFVERSLWGEDGILRSTGIASPLTPEVRKSELSLRRTMLTMHQIGGFVTVGLMATTLYYGQMSLTNPAIRSYRRSHQTSVTFTIISYGATGALAALSPPPFIRRDEVSTTTIHKTLAWVHFVGMIATPILGASLKRSFQYDKLARFHQIAGYVTGGTLLASLLIVTF